MTLPYERFELIDAKKTPRVPKDIRLQALFVLRLLSCSRENSYEI
jgi:hypothetical protein